MIAYLQQVTASFPFYFDVLQGLIAIVNMLEVKQPI
ncbi:hypothetical protein M086_1719, partial [Bacteroides fragilis str. S13 L11]